MGFKKVENTNFLNRCSDSQRRRYLWNILKPSKKLAARALSGLKTLLLVFLKQNITAA